jgi:hypothetical protein
MLVIVKRNESYQRRTINDAETVLEISENFHYSVDSVTEPYTFTVIKSRSAPYGYRLRFCDLVPFLEREILRDTGSWERYREREEYLRVQRDRLIESLRVAMPNVHQRSSNSNTTGTSNRKTKSKKPNPKKKKSIKRNVVKKKVSSDPFSYLEV